LNRPRTWLITGASRGIGRALIVELLARGEKVAATARNADDLAGLAVPGDGNFVALAMDVTDESTVAAARDAAVKTFGRIDVLVNNAGSGLIGAIEEVSQPEIQALFETNVFGPLRVIRSILPVMRAQKSGYIINIGSIAGRIGSAGSGLYCASKFAVAGISEALAAELAPLNIHVTVVEPGAIRSDFLGRSYRETPVQIDDYAETVGRRRQESRAMNGTQPGDPVKVARAIADLAGAVSKPLHLVMGVTAHERALAKCNQLGQELADWAQVSQSIDFQQGSKA